MVEFSYPRPNLVVSSEGFSVEVVGQNGLRYQEAGREMLIFSEVLVSKEPTIIARTSDVRAWDAPHDDEAVTSEDQVRILGNIGRAFDWKGWHLQVE